MLLCFPINSIINFFEIISSNSSKPSNSKMTNLSKSNVIIFFNFRPIKFLRNNMQKLGATCGLGLEFVVKFILQFCESMHMFSA